MRNLRPIITYVMKSILTERSLVVVLFVMVLITFALAQEDSKKMERAFSGSNTTAQTTTDSLVVPKLP